MSAGPSDQALLAALGERFGGQEITLVRRSPYRYATSAPLEELVVATADGTKIHLLLKDLSRESLLEEARTSKPEFLHEPRRELETYDRIISPAGIGPRCYAAAVETNPSRQWLAIEKVSGVELWQVGELAVWGSVASWLADFHASFAGRVDEIRSVNPYLIEYAEEWYRSWRDRARAALVDSGDQRVPELLRALEHYDGVIARLDSLPRTFVHGELYPSNVLVDPNADPVRVYPVDWEMAGIGSGLLDVAALVGGWAAGQRRHLVAAYLEALPAPGASLEETARDLARCRLHLALQWLGWARDWRPPPEHAHDWVGEALALARDLGLS